MPPFPPHQFVSLTGRAADCLVHLREAPVMRSGVHSPSQARPADCEAHGPCPALARPRDLAQVCVAVTEIPHSDSPNGSRAAAAAKASAWEAL